MEEIFYVKGDDIIEQDDIGDSFFVLEEGTVVVTVRTLLQNLDRSKAHEAALFTSFHSQRKANMRDAYEKPRELARLSNNAHFGEIALLTAEPRSATVTVTSDTAKCLRMTKAKFDELLATTNKLHAENRRLIGRDVLDQVPLFRSLSAVNKKKLLDAMVPMTYLPTSYICRQATTGNTFYIITEGHCRVTVNCEDKTEKEVGKLRAGDFFGKTSKTFFF
jgi:CRP-like cAMP-binding protein